MPTLSETLGLSAAVGIASLIIKHVTNAAKHINGKQLVSADLCTERTKNVEDALRSLKIEIAKLGKYEELKAEITALRDLEEIKSAVAQLKHFDELKDEVTEIKSLLSGEQK